jgi:isoamylase
MVSAKILAGRPYPLGATADAHGTNFAVSSNGDEVRLCLFDAQGTETQLVLPERDGDVWHGFVPGVTGGQAYGFRVSGPYDPGQAAVGPLRTRDRRRGPVRSRIARLRNG